jgi:hypothetical protein
MERVVEEGATSPANVISPKVKAGVIGGASISVVLSAMALVFTMATPEMFADLGPYAILASTFITALGAGISAYLKNDPDRISQKTIHEYAETQVKAAIAEYEAAEAKRKLREAEHVETVPVLPVSTEDAVLAPEEYHNAGSVVG